MIKELEALKRVVNEMSNYKLHGIGDENWLGIQDILKDIDIIEKALKRNEPMKPNYGGKFPECPVCRKLLHSIWQKHCDNCTQAIDWSDDK